MILERLPIERQTLLFFAVCPGFLVEPTSRFVAKPLVLEHLVEEIRQPEVAALVMHVLCHVAHDVTEDVEADQVNRAERSRLRPSHRLSRERVHLFDGQVHFLHQAHNVQH